MKVPVRRQAAVGFGVELPATFHDAGRFGEELRDASQLSGIICDDRYLAQFPGRLIMIAGLTAVIAPEFHGEQIARSPSVAAEPARHMRAARIGGLGSGPQPQRSRRIEQTLPGAALAVPNPALSPSSSSALIPCEWVPGPGWRSHRKATPGGRPRCGACELDSRGRCARVTNRLCCEMSWVDLEQPPPRGARPMRRVR